MGRGVSKLHGSSLVKLCKERKEFIKAAKYCRYNLVTSFVVYLESLLELGNTLNTYVEQELIICGGDFLSLSDFDDSSEEDDDDFCSELSSFDSESDLHSLLHHSNSENEEEESRNPRPGSKKVRNESCTCQNHNDSRNREKPRVESTCHQERPNLSSKNPHHNNEKNAHSHGARVESTCHQERPNLSSKNPHHNNEKNARIHGARVESTCHREWSNLSSKNPHHSNEKNAHNHGTLPRDYDHGHHVHGPRMSYGNRWEAPQSREWSHQEQNQGNFGAPMSFSFHNDSFIHYGNEAFTEYVTPHNHVVSQMHETEQNKPSTIVPPLPSPPHVTAWDFLYPFSQNDDIRYYNDIDLRRVREEEGIPDLEEIGNSPAMLKPVFDKKEKESGMRHGMNQGIPDLEDATEDSSTATLVFDEKEMESGMKHDGSSDNGTSNVTQLNPKEDALSTKGKELTNWRKGNEKDKQSEAEETNVEGRMSLKEAVLDIRNEFKHVFDCGKEFSYLVIEVAKLPHHSISTKLKAFASCVLGLIIPSLQTCFLPSYMLYQPVSRPRKLSNADKRKIRDHVCIGDLSSTLDMLYVLEKKLYGEVIVEEKIRIPYDKLCKKLKKLDDKGAEADMIDSTLASIKLLESEITVACASITSISRDLHELRDNKLLPELNKLIEGLFRLWKDMSICHQKQLQSITKAKSHVHILDPENRKKSTSKATLRLERLFLKWGMCFSSFIDIQKAFLKNLNDWLLRHISREPEETGDGISPFLQSDIGAPPIFRVCNDWYCAIDKISDTGVSEAIINCASNLHQLYEELEEEKALKATVKSLLKDYQHRLKSICNENGINHFISFINMKASENFIEDEVPLLRASDESLETLRKRLIEQRKRHIQVIRHVNDAASSCLQEGLPPIFEALEKFCLENLNIYEQLRLQNTGAHE